MRVGYVNLLSDLKHFACPIVFDQGSQLLILVDYRLQLLLYVSYSKAEGDAPDYISWVSRISTFVDISDQILPSIIILSFVVLHLMNLIYIKSSVNPDPLLSTTST